MDATTTDTPEQAVPLEQAEDLSLSEHEQEFSTKRKDPATADTPVTETPRDEKTGQFQGDRRHRARSQRAGVEDVPRIKELTARAKAAEEKAAIAEAELGRLRVANAPPAQIQRAEAKVEQTRAATGDDPEPRQGDPKYGGDVVRFVQDHARWAARDEWRQQETKKETAVKHKAKEESEREILRTFGQRMDKAIQKYPDFKQVALSEQLIPIGSVTDAWIMEHPAGPEVLYYLCQPDHRAELDSLLSMSVMAQAETLALLSQRLLSAGGAQAGTTGSVASPKVIVLPPKPPNPVRTEAQRTSESGPPTDRELSVAEHEKYYGHRRR